MDWENIAHVRIHARAAEDRIKELEAEIERLKEEVELLEDELCYTGESDD